MEWTTYQLIIATTMLITGSINTLSTKWADRMSAEGQDGIERQFNHPFVQAVGMFIGEWSCMLVFKLSWCYSHFNGGEMALGPQQFNPLIFLPAALCDMTATSLMYIGLNLTFASSFQMLRGAIMIFTAFFSKIFLHRLIKRHMWLGIFIVLVGLVAVGISDMLFNKDATSDINGIISGDLLIIMAQIVGAVQMVYEEKFITKHDVPPLQVVGWEGFFGFVVLSALLAPMYFIKIGPPFSTDPNGRMENVVDAFIQMGNNHLIILAVVGTIISIAFFNFAGVSVTKELSATTRMVLDSARTLVIWAVSLALSWQPFHWDMFLVQGAGFVLLVAGMCLYNNIVFTPLLRRVECLNPEEEDDTEPLLPPANSGINGSLSE